MVIGSGSQKNELCWFGEWLSPVGYNLVRPILAHRLVKPSYQLSWEILAHYYVRLVYCCK